MREGPIDPTLVPQIAPKRHSLLFSPRTLHLLGFQDSSPGSLGYPDRTEVGHGRKVLGGGFRVPQTG